MFYTKLIIILIGTAVCSANMFDVEDVYTCDVNYSVVYEREFPFTSNVYKRSLLIDFNGNYTECFSKCYNMSDEQLEMIVANNYTWEDFTLFVEGSMHNVTKEQFCERDDICCRNFTTQRQEHYEVYDNTFRKNWSIMDSTFRMYEKSKNAIYMWVRFMLTWFPLILFMQYVFAPGTVKVLVLLLVSTQVDCYFMWMFAHVFQSDIKKLFSNKKQD